MPIRFRCAYCNQLMGIARRKAGSVVKCPKCAGEIIVPTPEGMETGPEGVELAGNDAVPEPQVDVPAIDFGPTAVATDTSAPMPVLPPPPRERLGVFLSIASLAVSVVVIILLLILMFVFGLVIGRQTVTSMQTRSSFSPLPTGEEGRHRVMDS
jgi:hypothetical protein